MTATVGPLAAVSFTTIMFAREEGRISNNADSDSTPITPKAVFQIITSKTSLIQFAVLLLFALLVAITNVWGFPLFTLFIEYLVASLVFMTFIILIVSPHKLGSSFFIILGIGYAFGSVLRFVVLVSYPWVFLSYPRVVIDGEVFAQRVNYQQQVRIAFQFLEILALVFGLIFAKRVFNGKKPIIITAISFGLLFAFELCGIYWWNIFPTCFTTERTQTPFKVVLDILSPICFGLVGILLTLRRNAFTLEVYTHLMVAITFRCIGTALNIGVNGK